MRAPELHSFLRLAVAAGQVVLLGEFIAFALTSKFSQSEFIFLFGMQLFICLMGAYVLLFHVEWLTDAGNAVELLREAGNKSKPRPVDRGPSQTRSKRWWLTVVAWDVLLPVLVILSQLGLAFLWPRDIVEFALWLLIPVAAALARSSAGMGHLVSTCGDQPGWQRQFAFAAAVITMLMFEIATAILWGIWAVPLVLWCLPLGMYLLYLSNIIISLRPEKDRQNAEVVEG